MGEVEFFKNIIQIKSGEKSFTILTASVEIGQEIIKFEDFEIIIFKGDFSPFLRRQTLNLIKAR